MRLFLILISLIISTSINSQNRIIIRILGQSNYVESAESNSMMLRVKNSEINKIHILSDSLFALGYKSVPEKVNDYSSHNFSKFRINEASVENFDRIMVLCNELLIPIVSVFYMMPEHSFEDEDIQAILALRNANSQAKIIANHLNKKVLRILNIDDDTTYANSFYDNIDLDSERGQLILKLLEVLSRRNEVYSKDSKEEFRNGAYTLWVTYELN
ncbi:hypothetical protein [Winogradskyella aurantiaca]|uniref:hypothetical protein n=1 Tax=Winogradskyella aurantiaca TaxID=2219558 RepID=UPI000E1D3167|nr:hypothetical protein [Winogradskyella aurantiaca]